MVTQQNLPSVLNHAPPSPGPFLSRAQVVKHTAELAQLVVGAGGVGALVDYCRESSGNNRLPAIMALGYIGAFSETLALAVIAGARERVNECVCECVCVCWGGGIEPRLCPACSAWGWRLRRRFATVFYGREG